MRKITFSAEEHVIKLARERAAMERTTLNAKFREWLEEYSQQEVRVEEAMACIDAISKQLQMGGRKFTREELTER